VHDSREYRFIDRLVESTIPKRDYEEDHRDCYWIDRVPSSLFLRSAFPIAIM
jgi:hypothetical protein